MAAVATARAAARSRSRRRRSRTTSIRRSPTRSTASSRCGSCTRRSITYPRTGDIEKDASLIPGLAEELPTDLRGRQDLRAHAPQGPQVLGRLGRQGLGLRARHQARAEPGVGRLGLLPRDRGGAGLHRRRRVQRRHHRHRDRRQDRQDHDQPRRAGHEDPVRPRRAVRGSHACGQVAVRRASSNPRRASGRTRSRSSTNREFVLKKNPNFPDIPGIPQGKIDKIRRSSSAQHRQDDAGRDQRGARLHDEDPPGDQLPQVRQKYSDRISRGSRTRRTSTTSS